MNRKIRLLLTIVMFIILPHIAYSITEFMIQETEKISLEADATDPDSDELVTTYAPPLNEKGEWQTAYGDAGEYPVTVTVTDGESTTTREVLIIVKKKEEPPAIVSLTPSQNVLRIKETESINFSISASDLNKDILSYKWFLDDEEVKDGQEYIYETTYNDAGSHKISVVVSDGTSSISKKWSVDVNDVDRAPTFEKLENKVVHENEEITIILNANDLDNDEIRYSASNMPEGAELNESVFTWKPGFNTVKTEGFFDRIIDKFIVLSKDFHIQFTVASKDEKTTQNVIVTVKDVTNRVPLFGKIPKIKAGEDDNIAVLLDARDPDGDEITYLIDNPPEDSSLKGNVFLWTPRFDTSNKGEIKKIDLVFVASDGKAETRQIAKVEIIDKNRVPKIIDVTKSIVAKVNEPVLMFVKAIDEDGDELTYTWDFGLLERYKATSTHQRTFIATGTKKVKVIVSDGIDEVVQVINVNVKNV